MSNPILAVNGVVPLNPSSFRPNEEAAVLVQGNANDFVWSVQAKASPALSFVDLPTISAVTGLAVKSFIPCRDVEYQVKVTNMGTATAVYVRSN